jgi:hypothetical protein
MRRTYWLLSVGVLVAASVWAERLPNLYLGPCWYHICYASPQQIDHRTPLRLAIIGSGLVLSSVFGLLSLAANRLRPIATD